MTKYKINFKENKYLKIALLLQDNFIFLFKFNYFRKYKLKTNKLINKKSYLSKNIVNCKLDSIFFLNIHPLIFIFELIIFSCLIHTLNLIMFFIHWSYFVQLNDKFFHCLLNLFILNIILALLKLLNILLTLIIFLSFKSTICK